MIEKKVVSTDNPIPPSPTEHVSCHASIAKNENTVTLTHTRKPSLNESSHKSHLKYGTRLLQRPPSFSHSARACQRPSQTCTVSAACHAATIRAIERVRKRHPHSIVAHPPSQPVSQSATQPNIIPFTLFIIAHFSCRSSSTTGMDWPKRTISCTHTHTPTQNALEKYTLWYTTNRPANQHDSIAPTHRQHRFHSRAETI